MKPDRHERTAPDKEGILPDRRKLLKQAIWTAAAAAFQFRARAASDSVSRAMAKLSEYMCEAGDRALPAEVAEAAKHHILDTFGAMISGSELPAGRAALRFVHSYGGEKVSTVVCSNVLCGPMEAALANAEMAHADETDDSHQESLSHPGCATVPAALAAGGRLTNNGNSVMRAVAAGYDVGTRITMTLGLEPIQKAHRDSHPIVEIFAAATAAATAAGLNAQQMRWVLDYTAQQCSGLAALYRDTEHIEKGFAFAGMGARSGVTAALLVEAGWTGIDDIFSGADNFLLAYSPQADPARLVEALGSRWEVTRTNIKKWSVGSPIQAPLDALQNLQKAHHFEADQVKQVVVRVGNGFNAVNNREMPDICLQHMIAVMLLDKTASFRAAHDKERMKDPAVLRERAKVQFLTDEELKRRSPSREAIVEVTLADGSQFTEHVTGVRGAIENPMTREEVIGKFNDLSAPVLGAEKSAKFIEKIFALESLKDVRDLRPFLQLS